jgi:NAD(P)-dependent dehydrogenase (short-subunit alcohol dehydrogenase family)
MDKRVLITAGARGIGQAMANAFAEAGAHVWIVDCDASALAACPPDWHKDQLDVTDEGGVAALLARLEAAWGGLDVLCANAGIAGPTASVENVALEDWRRCLGVNLDGAFLVVKHSVPLMKRQRAGSIILTSSTAGLYGFPNRSPYCASKWALNGLMKTLAMELGPFGIRANSICPGAVEGARMEAVLEREAALKNTTRDALYHGYAQGTSMRAFVSPQDVAATALFLGSDAAKMISGQMLAVDGHTENPDPKV